MSSGETPNQPGSDGIEKWSKIEELEQPESKRLRSSLQVSPAPPEPKDDPTILEFPASILEGTGLYNKEEKVVLYRRENVNALFTFLDDVLNTRTEVFGDNNPCQQGWILGPPGVGKSLAVFAFTRSLPVSEWSVTWIHCRSSGSWFNAVHRDNTGQSITNFPVEDGAAYVNQFKVENKHLLVLDGFTNDTSNSMKAKCELWLKADFEMRRFVVVCSMASHGKSNDADDEESAVKEFSVCSWTLEEYKAAVEKPVLYTVVKEKLGTDTEKSRDEFVDSKYYFAGGSACYMFQKYTNEVKVSLNSAIKRIADIRAFTEGLTGLTSPGFVHLLVSIQDGIPGIVSQYAGNGLAVKLGTQLIYYFTGIYGSKLSPPMKANVVLCQVKGRSQL